ncbi:pleckstrin homology domain-containing protein [Ditylenchus destructor]|nr:pleckstrin homology domain-containing protein [Ditylenchus destructor]
MDVEECHSERTSPSLARENNGSVSKDNVDKALSIPPSFYKRSSPLRSSLRKHGQNNGHSRQKSPGRKTVSFCSDKKVSNVADCLTLMQNGTELIKLRTNVRQFRRLFTLDTDCAYIRWTPTNKKPHKARIAVDSIKEVRVGWNTELLRSTEINGGDVQPHFPDCAFSIIYGDDYEVLDLIALTPDDANVWVVGLMALTSGLNGIFFDHIKHNNFIIQKENQHLAKEIRWLLFAKGFRIVIGYNNF